MTRLKNVDSAATVKLYACPTISFCVCNEIPDKWVTLFYGFSLLTPFLSQGAGKIETALCSSYFFHALPIPNVYYFHCKNQYYKFSKYYNIFLELIWCIFFFSNLPNVFRSHWCVNEFHVTLSETVFCIGLFRQSIVINLENNYEISNVKAVHFTQKNKYFTLFTRRKSDDETWNNLMHSIYWWL